MSSAKLIPAVTRTETKIIEVEPASIFLTLSKQEAIVLLALAGKVSGYSTIEGVNPAYETGRVYAALRVVIAEHEFMPVYTLHNAETISFKNYPKGF